MDKIFEKVEGPLQKVATFFSTSPIFSSIQAGFMMMLPITMIGSFTSMFRGLDIGGYQDFIVNTGIWDLLGVLYTFTMGLFAVYAAFCVAYQFAMKNGLRQAAVTVGLTAMMSFFCVVPFTHATSIWGSATLSTSYYGASGLFTALIMSFVVGYIYKFCKVKNIAIHMPEQVPPTISAQFTALIPAVLSGVVALLLCFGFSKTSYGSFADAIYSIIRTPLAALGSNILSYWFIMLFCTICWFFGIHGGLTVMPFSMMLFTELQTQNQAAYAAGEALPNWVTGSSLSLSSGSLCTVICILLFCKSKSNRAIATAAIVPSLFGVDEPAYFGLPMIMNPMFFIPWTILQSMISIFGTYLLQAMHLLGYYRGISAGSFVPPFVTNFFGYGWAGVFWGFVLFGIDMVITYPFVKAYDKQMLAQEAEEEGK